jgi:DNA-binding beta-propeller fold protein YncE
MAEGIPIREVGMRDGLQSIAAVMPLINSIVGPPTKLAITPAGDIALVANSVAPSSTGADYKLASDDKLFAIDLKASPPSVIATLTTDKRPSGLAISPNGALALVTIDHITVGDSPKASPSVRRVISR